MLNICGLKVGFEFETTREKKKNKIIGNIFIYSWPTEKVKTDIKGNLYEFT